MKSELGPIIQALDIDGADEELYICLLYMNALVLKDKSPVYLSLKTAQPPDLPLGWNDEEINELQDRYTIDCVKNMRKFIYQTFDSIYEKIKSTGSVEKFFPDSSASRESHAKFFEEAYQSAGTRCIQYEYHLKHLTHIPILECSNFTPDLRAPSYQLVDKEGNVLTETNLGFPNSYGIPGLEAYLGKHYEEVAKDFDRVITEVPIEEINKDWYYFEPNDDHTLKIVATEPLLKGEQMPYHYGWCSSRFLLINYGFCLPDNPADALIMRLSISGEEKILLLHR